MVNSSQTIKVLSGWRGSFLGFFCVFLAVTLAQRMAPTPLVSPFLTSPDGTPGRRYEPHQLGSPGKLFISLWQFWGCRFGTRRQILRHRALTLRTDGGWKASRVRRWKMSFGVWIQPQRGRRRPRVTFRQAGWESRWNNGLQKFDSLHVHDREKSWE